MKLYLINITLSHVPNPVQLLFKDEANARAAYDTIIRGQSGNDDFGRSFVVKQESWSSIVLSDYALELDGRQEIAILEAHAQAKLQKRAATDPMLQQPRGIVAPGANGPLPFGGLQRS